MSDAADARKRAQEYKDKQADESPESEAKKAKLSPADKALLDWNDMISNRIEEAMREGHFDNLRGKGKPLNLARNPFVPEEMEMAFSLLEKNELAPAWISKRTEVLKAIVDWRTKVEAGVKGRRGEGENGGKGNGEMRWQKQLDTWRQELGTLNQRIEVINLEQPVASLEIYKLLWEEELVRAQKD